jgi:hypothetical protein
VDLDRVYPDKDLEQDTEFDGEDVKYLEFLLGSVEVATAFLGHTEHSSLPEAQLYFLKQQLCEAESDEGDSA